jgi:hypothetical protein
VTTARVMIDRSQLLQPGQAQHDLTMQGHAAADQAGVPPLRDDGHAGVSAQAQHSRNLGRITRPNDGRRMALEPARPVNSETGRRVTSQDMRLAHDGGQRPEQRARQRHHPLSFIGPPVPDKVTGLTATVHLSTERASGPTSGLSAAPH